MERKEFLFTGGALITAAMLAACSIDLNGAAPEVSSETAQQRRLNQNDFKEPILKALTLALNAPNPHNTQAWKFKLINSMEALLFVDKNRTLPATDPTTRQVHIGCGCFAAVFKMGATSLGSLPSVEYLPEGEYAIDQTGLKPVAHLTLLAAEVEEEPLVKHLYDRQSNRGKYTGSLVTQKEFDEVLRKTRSRHSGIKLYNDPTTLPAILELLYKGMEVECNDWAAYDESRQWFRVKDDIAEKKDGINLRTNGMTGLKRWVAETMLSGYSKKTWHNKGNIESYLKNHHDVVMSSKGVVTFLTKSNQVIDWLKCGEDYARFQFAAYDEGFFIHPLSQVLQEFSSMKKLFHEFNDLMQVTEPAKIQMAVRIGRGTPLDYSYRRNTKDFLI